MNESMQATDLDPAQDDVLPYVPFFERSLTAWASDESTTIAVGDWSDGSVMELVGETYFLSSRYAGCFAGVRELRARDSSHHAHVDLGRIHSVEYVITPSVCLGFRPALEVRYLTAGPGGRRTGRVMVRALINTLYAENDVNDRVVSAWYEAYRRDVCELADRVRLVVAAETRSAKEGPALLSALGRVSGLSLRSWPDATQQLTRAEKPAVAPSKPTFLNLLEDAISLYDASLVIFRDRTLVEFKTDDLAGVFEYTEGGHTSWQIGAFDAHHCHLALDAVTAVEFSAEPVPCQGNRLNYTIWFLVSGGCGNPFRSDGYFSVTLNRPYKGDEPRWDVIRPLVDLNRKYRQHAWVRADDGFIRALAEIPSA
ncbi:MAG: hypothetical protein AAFQ82_00540 [Myxococcota bacterium]